MNNKYILLITWALLLMISYFCWQSYQQLSKAQTQIHSLETQLDSLKTTVRNYHTLHVTYTEIHQSLSKSHGRLSQISNQQQVNASDHLAALAYIKQQLDSIQWVYDTLHVLTLPSVIDQDLSFKP